MSGPDTAPAAARFLAAEAHVRLDDVAARIGLLCEQLAEHGARVERDGTAWCLSHRLGRASLRAGRGTLLLRAEALDATALVQLRGVLAWHVERIDGEGTGPAVVWTGDGCDTDRLPHLRVMRVVRNSVLAAGMHVRLLLPPPGEVNPEWPRAGANGLPIWPRSPRAVVPRVYTLRRVDAAAGTVDVDIVVHGDEGPGTRWARRAAPGDRGGMIGPGGGGVPEADWVLLAGDETALPAIARMLEELPPATRGVAILEVGGPAGEQLLVRPPGVSLRWLHRGDAAPGTMDLLRDAVSGTPWPAVGMARAWVAAEAGTADALRQVFRDERGLARDTFTCAAFWRRAEVSG